MRLLSLPQSRVVTFLLGALNPMVFGALHTILLISIGNKTLFEFHMQTKVI